MAPASLGARGRGEKLALPSWSQRSKGTAPAGAFSPQITTCDRPVLPFMSIRDAALSSEATTARAPESSTMYFTSSGVSMVLMGFTIAPVLAVP